MELIQLGIKQNNDLIMNQIKMLSKEINDDDNEKKANW